MEFRILGPLDVVEGGTPVALGAHKQRALLAILLLSHGKAVAVDRLTDELWGEHAPANAAKSIQVYVSQLRKVLGPEVLETRGRAYAIRIAPEQLDAVRFERLLDEGRGHLEAGDSRLAASVIREALALWRGDPLADFAYEPFAQVEVGRLQELRLAALEERIEADLALGHDRELVPQLESLVHEHPLRERLRAQLMLALYRAGRQAEALEVYAGGRRAFVDELGIEPGPALRELQAGILAQDPGLAGPARSLEAFVRRRRKGGMLIALGGAAVLVAAAVAAVITLTGSEDAGHIQPLPASFCSPMQYKAGAPPRFLLVSDQELQGPEGQLGTQIARVVEHVVQSNGFKAGRHALAYQACDDATEAEGGSGADKCAANARAYADNPSVIGVIGPTLSACAVVQLPIANRGRSGPVPMISGSNTRVGLTRAGLGAEPDEPERYYSNGIRNYVRILAADDFQAAADAVLAQRLGLRKVFVLAQEDFPAVANAFRAAAAKLGVAVAGTAVWSTEDAEYPEIVRRVRRSRIDGVFLAGALSGGGDRMLRDLRAELGARVRLVASDGFAVPPLLEGVGKAAEGLLVSVAGVPPDALKGEARRMVSRLQEGLGEPLDLFSIRAAQATQLMLDAIGRSDGTRRSVIRELFASKVRDGVLGDFDVTEDGDTTANQVAIYRVTAGRLRLDRVINPPFSLVVRR